LKTIKSESVYIFSKSQNTYWNSNASFENLKTYKLPPMMPKPISKSIH